MRPSLKGAADTVTPFVPTSNGIFVHVRLAPKSASDRIGGLQADGEEVWLKVAVTAPPESGKANAALIKLLAKDWRVPKSSITIAKGAAHRRKVLKVDGDSKGLMELLSAWNSRYRRE